MSVMTVMKTKQVMYCNREEHLCQIGLDSHPSGSKTSSNLSVAWHWSTDHSLRNTGLEYFQLSQPCCSMSPTTISMKNNEKIWCNRSDNSFAKLTQWGKGEWGNWVFWHHPVSVSCQFLYTMYILPDFLIFFPTDSISLTHQFRRLANHWKTDHWKNSILNENI